MKQDAKKKDSAIKHDTYDCDHCLKDLRYCWKDDKWKAVTFTRGLPPLVVTKKELPLLLPLLDPIEYLVDSKDAPRIDGKKICPVPLCEHQEAQIAIQVETDMSGGEGGWGLGWSGIV